MTNLMDYGSQLGRRFRALKLWMVLRAFGAEGLRERIRAHCAMARSSPPRSRPSPDSSSPPRSPSRPSASAPTAAPPPRTTTAATLVLLARINAAGPYFLSHTALRGRHALRVAIGNLRTEEEHLEALWDEIRRSAAALA